MRQGIDNADHDDVWRYPQQTVVVGCRHRTSAAEKNLTQLEHDQRAMLRSKCQKTAPEVGPEPRLNL